MKWLLRLRTVLEVILDAVVPQKARAARTRSRDASDIPLSPTVHDLLGVRITTLMDYRDEAVQDLIRSLKYDASQYAASLAATLLADYLREEIAAAKTFSTNEIFIIPVPLHASRSRERGFNQIELVLNSLPEEFKNGTLSHMKADALTRNRATKPQTKLSRSERLSNVAGAFEAMGSLKKTHVFLIDDVTTTGATLANAGNALRRAGAEVTLLALARA